MKTVPNCGKALGTHQSVNSAVKSICDIMRRSNCAGALQYVPELTRILFLRILDEREAKEAEQARAVGADFTPSQGIEARGYDLKAMNPNAKRDEDTRTPEELLDVIEAKGREVADAIAELRKLL